MTTNDPIRRVSVVSTGAVQIHPEHMASTWQPTWLWVLTSRRWTAPRPINVYVIEHRDGLVLFDTGQDRASITDPRYFPTGFLMGPLYRMAKFEMAEDQTLSALLAGLGYSAGDVGTAIVSHLHGDHIGGLRELGQAELLVSRAEWHTLSGLWPELLGVMRKHIELPGLKWREIEPRPLRDPSLAPFDTGHDLFGDGSLVMVPTPGHTPGSSSLIVRRPGRPTLALVGDLTYEARLLACGHVPGVGNRRVLRRSTAMMNQLRQACAGLVVLAAHDPGAAAALAAAV
ncbi:MAG: N-acyl homoserine lactonase family protein [Alphaproteobacteria bacterium]|nr:N-acyl homoserine lactonase family protein [Alphaproteobacteria bacterium]